MYDEPHAPGTPSGPEDVGARLHVVHPPALAQDAALLGPVAGPVVVGGRPGDAGMCVSHPTVSPRHIRLSWDPMAGGHTVEDLGSRDGTFVDGRRVGKKCVSVGHGSVVRLGEVVTVYERVSLPWLARTVRVSRDAVPGESSAIERLRTDLLVCARSPGSVLLVGEPGTGKERIAGEIHRLSGRPGPMVTFDCAGSDPGGGSGRIPGGGPTARAGPRTGGGHFEKLPDFVRAADRGTLFLDRIGELPLAAQSDLLRHLRAAGPAGARAAPAAPARVIASTTRDLAVLVEEGWFCRDLYAHIAHRELRVPPIRERRADIVDLAGRLVARLDGSQVAPSAEKAPDLDVEAVELLLLHPWPDNLRGLCRLARKLGSSDVPIVTCSHLEEWLPELQRRAPPEPDEPGASSSDPRTAAARRRPAPTEHELVEAMDRFGGSVRAVARYYSRDRKQVYRWLCRYGLDRRR